MPAFVVRPFAGDCDIGGFDDVSKYESYCRFVGSAHMSTGRKNDEGNTRKRISVSDLGVCGRCNFAIRYCQAARKFYQRTKDKQNGIVAIKAVCHAFMLSERTFNPTQQLQFRL